MPEYQEPTSSQLLTGEQWMAKMTAAANTLKQEIARDIATCEDTEIMNYRAEWRAVERMVRAMQGELNRDE